MNTLPLLWKKLEEMDSDLSNGELYDALDFELHHHDGELCDPEEKPYHRKTSVQTAVNECVEEIEKKILFQPFTDEAVRLKFKSIEAQERRNAITIIREYFGRSG